MNTKNLSTGVLLINLGTPNSATTKDVRTYLKEFLWDKRILDIFWLFRWLLLYLIILPTRSKRSAKLYQKIWTSKGSPLMVWGKESALKLQQQLGENYTVQLAMRYGNPSIAEGIKCLTTENIEHLIIVPLFPQYAAGTTGSIIEETAKCLNTKWHIPTYTIVKPFFQNHYFIQAFKERIQQNKQNTKSDFILFSYHGLPKLHLKKAALGRTQSSCEKNNQCCDSLSIQNNFCYRAQCFETTRLIANACELLPHQYTTAFQSRFGKNEWLTPDTQTILTELYAKRIRTLAVVCPGFVADCLETLEEIQIRLKEQWLELGGTDLVLVESLNDNHTWILCLEAIIREHANH